MYHNDIKPQNMMIKIKIVGNNYVFEVYMIDLDSIYSKRITGLKTTREPTN